MWTRESLDAARVLLRAVFSSVGGNSADEGGNGAWRSLESSSAGTVERTSERRESLRNSTKLARTGAIWLPRNSRTLHRRPSASGSSNVPPRAEIPRTWTEWRATSLARRRPPPCQTMPSRIKRRGCGALRLVASSARWPYLG